MSCVSLVCTVHEEKGLATVQELQAILVRIKPEVIFSEIPAASYEDYYGTCSRSNLESRAVRQYRELHQVTIVPVDLPTPDEEFFSDNRSLFEHIERNSHEYRRLIDQHSYHVSVYGFAYLNSEYCDKLWSDVDEETLRSIRQANDTRMLELFQLWHDINDRRDAGIMDNILRYCRSNPFNKAVFLVGAAHRKSIIEKAREQSAMHSIQWDFSAGPSQTN